MTGLPPVDQAAPGRQYVVLSGTATSDEGGLAPIDTRADLIDKLVRCNTGPERAESSDVLYGPGIRLELTPGQDPVTQMLMTITEEEIGWQVIARLLREFRWRLLDPATGRELATQPTDFEAPQHP